jgi:saccharopine dehydrogenase (NADP+, L-glutamate forming)/spermidine synthase
MDSVLFNYSGSRKGKSMKKVLVLGAGLVAKPLVRYLLDHGFNVKVASRTVSKAEALVGDHPNGETEAWQVDDTDRLKEMIGDADLSISLLPAAYHPVVAEMCIESKKQMVTTSYVSPRMKSLDGRAKEAGVLVLNEIGLDPGIDHMSAMKIIHEIQGRGGRVESFRSYCGGLPAPEANTNPFGYKFSWSPKGVVLAGKNSAKYLLEGDVVNVPGPELFTDVHHVEIPEIGMLEAYPNRDSMGYLEIYGLEGISTLYRGTFRNLGWCETWKKMVDIGLLDEDEMSLEGMSYADMMSKLAGKSGADNAREAVAESLGIATESDALERMDWLGLFSDATIGVSSKAPIDVLCDLLLEKLKYEHAERDMIILHHEFISVFDSNNKEKTTSSLVDFGEPDGDSSMARTVGLPAAIAARLILEGKIKETGVHIPVEPEIYQPVLEELEELGISFTEKTEAL